MRLTYKKGSRQGFTYLQMKGLSQSSQESGGLSRRLKEKELVERRKKGKETGKEGNRPQQITQLFHWNAGGPGNL